MRSVPSSFRIGFLLQSFAVGSHNTRISLRIVIGACVLFLTTQIGVASATVNSNYVTATYDPVQQLIVLTGDGGNNSISVTWKANVVTVAGSGLTRIGTAANNSSSVSFHTGASIGIQAALGGGDDSILIRAVRSPNISLDLGDGNDFARLTYCSVTTLTVTGGIGNDTFSRTASRITTATYPGVEVFLPPQ